MNAAPNNEASGTSGFPDRTQLLARWQDKPGAEAAQALLLALDRKFPTVAIRIVEPEAHVR